MKLLEQIAGKFRPERAEVPWRLLTAFILLAVGISFAGYLYFSGQKTRIVQATYRDLGIIADFKVDEIQDWRNELLYDASTMFGIPVIAERVEQWFKSGYRDDKLRQELLAWMDAGIRKRDFDGIFILDAQANVRLAETDTNSGLDAQEKSLALESLENSKIIFSDLYREEGTGEICIAMLIPLLISKKDGSFPAGVAFLKIHADHYLFSLVKSWPVPSKTAEMLLVRREGDRVLYLNNLRYRDGAALTLTMPASAEHLPAAMALRGTEGRMEGLNYRGVPVFAVAKKIPDTSWFLIAEMEKSEIYGPIYEREITVAGLVATMIAATALGVLAMWRKREAVLRKRNEEELSKAYAELEIKAAQKTHELLRAELKLAEAKHLSDIGTLAARVAHELRNPLGVIKTAAYNLKRKMPDGTLDKHIANIEEKIAESSQIINNLLFYSRIKQENHEKVAVAGILEGCIADLAERFHDQNVFVDKRLEPIGNVKIDADIFQIREVFNNILVNAYQSLSGDEKRIAVEGKKDSNGCIEVVISDNGEGIDAQDLQQVFEPFFTRKSKGTGLGLAICREIVRIHNGDITIESEKGKGTRVSVRFPIEVQI